jgi:hypothetical protein
MPWEIAIRIGDVNTREEAHELAKAARKIFGTRFDGSVISRWVETED